MGTSKYKLFPIFRRVIKMFDKASFWQIGGFYDGQRGVPLAKGTKHEKDD
jgi:hypothetical protein